MQPRNLPEVGDHFAEFDIECRIGSGAMATVFRAHSSSLGTVALKVLSPHLAADENARNMFQDEAMITRQLSHPHIARALASGTERGLPYLALEYVAGPSYAECQERAAARSSGLPLGFHLLVLTHAAEGLHAAHVLAGADGLPLALVHRDVKPQNIIVSTSGQVKVTDFGVSAARGRLTRTATGRTKGTLAYMAPEQFTRPKEVDRRVDVWALGVVAWEALNQRRLFQADTDGNTTWNVVHAPIPALRADVPELVSDCIGRCLERDPEKRPASCAPLAEVFEEAAARLGWSSAEMIGQTLREQLDS